MNRLELEQLIKDEGNKRGIIVTRCLIADHKDKLVFIPTIVNEREKDWVYEHQVHELIHDLAPLERPHEIKTIELAPRVFKLKEKVQLNKIWVRLDAGEDDPKTMNISSVCGQWRSGWYQGEVFETPEQNGRFLGIVFDRDVYLEREPRWFGHVSELEKLIKTEAFQKVEKGQPVWCGTAAWTLRLAK